MLHISVCRSNAQDISPVTEQQLENLAGIEEDAIEDDSYVQQLLAFRKDPVNLNTTERDELKELGLLSDFQIDNFLSYRNLLGAIINIYELQAIPGWDIASIRRLLPFVTIANSVIRSGEWEKWFREGEHNLLLRIGQEKKNEEDNNYAGSRQKIFFRYKYSYKNLLQFGLLGDKDAGESFFSGVQKTGFDFYSFHLFARNIGIISALAIGDFTVNMGQGLIHWQSLAFKKSAATMGIKRQSTVLRPYNSAGEFNFHRGVGITIHHGKLEATGFFSLRKLSASIDTDQEGKVFTSFQTSGYHRTQSEIENNNNLRQMTVGANFRYSWNRFQLGVSGVYYRFSLPFKKQDEPYNHFAMKSDRWHNIGMDYSYTYKNIYLFGEAATDKNFAAAFLNGFLLSVDTWVDISLLYRNIARDYQSIKGNAFTENSMPSNENGIYIGMSIKPSPAWKFNVYADLYKFPWLKYRVDAPSDGSDFLAELVYTPNRGSEIYARFRMERKQGNSADVFDAMHSIEFLQKRNWRVQLSHKISKGLTFRSRFEVIALSRQFANTETGFLNYVDILYKPLQKPFSISLRCQYFETDSYDTRLYAYENGGLYNYSIPAFSGKGWRFYGTVNFDLNQDFSIWIYWTRTFLEPSKEALPDVEIEKSKSIISLQLRVSL